MTTTPVARTVEVPLRRLGPWLDGFRRRHSDAVMRAAGGGPDGLRWELTSSDGQRAVIEVPDWLSAAVGETLDGRAVAEAACGGAAREALDGGTEAAGGGAAGEALDGGTEAAGGGAAGEALGGEVGEALAADPETSSAAVQPTFAVLVVRRAGYAAAVFRGTERLWAKVGRRHVHGRTAAGGWSQQRYARRRANQADEVVSAVATPFAREVRPHLSQLAALATGGDRALLSQVRDVLRRTDPGLAEKLDALPEVRIAMGTPTSADLAAVPDRVLAVRIHLTDTLEGTGSDD